MKKAIGIVLAILMAVSCFAIAANARGGDTTSYTFIHHEGEKNPGYFSGTIPPMFMSDGSFVVKPEVSGKYKVSISHSGAFVFRTYKIFREGGTGENYEQIEFAKHEAFPESAEYDLVAGETYIFVFTLVNHGGAEFRFEVESPLGEKTHHDIIPEFHQSQGGRYKVTITHTGEFDLLYYMIGETTGKYQISYNSFPASAEYDLAPGEYLQFDFLIAKDIDEAVTIYYTVEELSTKRWDGLPSWVQWILRYPLFGWLWMRWF